MWLILADDLTGAADCAIAFARRGTASVVAWGNAAHSIAAWRHAAQSVMAWGHAAHSPAGSGHAVHVDGAHPVFAYDAASRGMSAAAAFRHHQALLAQFAGRKLFVKIDSTLRGQPAAAIAAAMRPDVIGILAPAFPATGRSTHNGHMHLEGAPLETTELWRRDHTYPTADLITMLATAGLTGHLIPLGIVRGPDLAARLRAIPCGYVAVCDAERQDDLARVARAAPSQACFIGSAGLAHALAETVPDVAALLPATPERRGTLVVVGSLARVSREAAQALAQLDGVCRVAVRPDAVAPDLAQMAAGALEQGRDVLVELVIRDHDEIRIDPGAAETLANALRPVAAHVGGLVATGGETAAALLHAFGVHGIRLFEEPEPGVSLGVTIGAIAVPLATKAGAFGDAGTLARIVRRLRQSGQRGTER